MHVAPAGSPANGGDADVWSSSRHPALRHVRIAALERSRRGCLWTRGQRRQDAIHPGRQHDGFGSADLRQGAGDDEGLLRDRLPDAEGADRRIHEAVPNVKWQIREDQFAVITQNAPRVLADDPPDLMRLPQVSDLVKDDLLKNLDGYAKAFGWDKWPASQLQQLRFGAGGT